MELSPNKDGMVHISKLSDKRVEKVEDVVNIGDEEMCIRDSAPRAAAIRADRQDRARVAARETVQSPTIPQSRQNRRATAATRTITRMTNTIREI